MRWVRRLALLAAIGMPPLLASPPPSAAEALSVADPSPRPYPALFGTREVFSPDTSAFTKWNSLLARFRAEQDRAAAACAPGRAAACEPREWRDLVAALRTRGLRAKLDLVNAAINRHPYVPSRRNWGERNYWETPFEFLRKNGQCQDYAVTKYLLLRAAGVPAEDLRVLVVRDVALGLDHAVTVAYVDGEALMLDNLIRDVVPVASVADYRPYYSINENGWWLHRGPNARYAAAGGAE
jgi:predicted transglutaminase-like cysteine proteinase